MKLIDEIEVDGGDYTIYVYDDESTILRQMYIEYYTYENKDGEELHYNYVNDTFSTTRNFTSTIPDFANITEEERFQASLIHDLPFTIEELLTIQKELK